MYYYEVAPNQIVRATSQTFTYHSTTPLAIGSLVVVEIGKKSLASVVVKAVDKPNYTTKAIGPQLEDQPLPTQLLTLASWLSQYYTTHLATVLQTMLPRGLTKQRRSRAEAFHTPVRSRTNIVFNRGQREALAKIESTPSGTILLHGITGSGKTAVYIEAAKRTLATGQSVIVLVPEISLTSQLVDELAQHFDDIILTHSRQTEAERHLAWRKALTSQQPRVAVGPRSALFIPLANVGLIIIDEAHEPSFKQEQAPRYSALRAASILARAHQGKLVLGSATPLIADYYLAKKTSQPIATLTESARHDTVKPVVELIDMTKRNNFKRHHFLSEKLLDSLTETFANGHQALIFHNRRGSASTTLCENCGWSALCPRCFVPMTLHTDLHQLRCHICGIDESVPTSCPVCSSTDILHKGIGTKRIETELRRLFPDKTIRRFDADTASADTVEQQYSALYSGEVDLIIGTQVIAKGLDLPKLRLVGVVQADAGLALPDYSSPERTFQLLAQVVGRVGRSHHPTTVIVQSYQPTHPAVTDGLAQNYHHFYETALVERKRGYFPPFCFLLKLTCVYKTEAAAIKNSRQLATTLHQRFDDIQILGPTPAFYERQHNTYRWQLVIKSPRRARLLEVLQHIPATHWQTELDPTSLI